MSPCPYCNSEDVAVVPQGRGWPHAARCNECGSTGPVGKSVKEAETLWEQRRGIGACVLALLDAVDKAWFDHFDRGQDRGLWVRLGITSDILPAFAAIWKMSWLRRKASENKTAAPVTQGS